MGLQKLVVYNFKSYKGHVTIGPFENFTCIIGPNGAGKSNLMDAISFVLGVKSVHLRSTALKDLVYRSKSDHTKNEAELNSDGDLANSDSENSDPTLQQGQSTAFVSAVYETKGGETMEFTRTITKQGGSEYRLNGKVVTFVTYSASLERENILSKARNFLVFQGDVESVASQSPKDLTRLIEIISGSLELKATYDELKAEHERAIEESSIAFNRKRAANQELKIVRQSKMEAEEYDKLNREYNSVTQLKMLWKMYHLKNEIIESETQQAELNAALAAKQAELLSHQTSLKDAKRQEAQTNKQLLEFQVKVKKQQALIDEKTPAVLQNNEKIRHTNKRLAVCRKNKQSLEQELAKIVKDRQDLEQELKQVTESQEQFIKSADSLAKSQTFHISAEHRELYNKLKQQLSTAALDDQTLLDKLDSDKQLAEQRLQLAEDKLHAINSRLKQLDKERAQLSLRERRSDEEKNKLLDEIFACKQSLDTQRSEQNRVENEEKELEEALAEVNTNLLDARVEQRESERDKKFREALSGMQRQYPKSVFGRMVDLCRPMHKKYEVALSVLMGKHMDAIVVDCEATALECIQYMRDHRAGRATFIPLDTIVVRPLSERLRGVSRGAKMAFDCIHVESRYERAIIYALGDALICDDLQTAKHIVFTLGERVKVVAINGTVIHKSGLMSGSTANSSEEQAQKWSASEVHKLKALLDDLKSKLSVVQSARSKLRSAPSLQTSLASLEKRLAKLNVEKSNVLRLQKSLEQERLILDEEAFSLATERGKLAEKQKAIETQFEEQRLKISEVEDAIFVNFCKETGFSSVREFEDREKEMGTKVCDQKLKFVSVQSKFQSQLKFLVDQEKQISSRVTVCNEQELKLMDELAKHERCQKELEGLVSSLVEQLVALKKEQSLVMQASDAVTTSVEAARSSVTQCANSVESCRRSLSQVEASRDELLGDWNSLVRKCRIEEIDLPLVRKGDEANTSALLQQEQSDPHSLDVDFSTLSPEARSNATAEFGDVIDEKLKHLMAEIDRMAPNLKEVVKLDEMEGKLKGTANDFEQRRKAARAAKEKFDAVKHQRVKLFNNAYEFISQRIDSVYKDLTSSTVFPLGGTAYLSVDENPEPYLEGIKYHAMPPMKRFRDMEALSGGEKTMAALALLFAIHQYKPAPFFVLDEVDAALDPTNVAKVARYLRTFSSDSFQILAISLKSTLYQQSQSLVGIYRDQNLGGSRTLCLKLDEFEE